MKKISISKDWQFSSPEHPEQINIDLPHDYSIFLSRNPKCPGSASNAFFEGTNGTYTKYMNFNNDEHVILDIDGAYMCARVFLNEQMLTMHPYGYTPFLVDLTGKMRKNAMNKIEITTQNIQPSTRWYSGAGLYRDVFLWTGGKVRIEPWDVFINTKSLSDNSAKISVLVEITSDIDTTITLNAKILSPDKTLSAKLDREITVSKGKNKSELIFDIENPALWSPETPCLYFFNAEIICNDKTEDTFDTKFGIRTVTADFENGLLLNGKPIKLRGGCIHHDHGALGAVALPAAEHRKLTNLKSVGFNAIRTAHYPPSLSQLELCDELGILVMDEAFDMWNVPKNNLDYSLWFADWWERDIKSMVLRDRNHPSVISYSIGNEIPERNCWSDGAIWSQKLSDEIRKYDNTKLVTSGICGFGRSVDKNAPDEYKEYFNQIMEENKGDGEDTSWGEWMAEYMKPLDIVGYNYYYKGYEHDIKRHPGRIMWGSETHVLNFYHSWNAVMKNNHVLGDFTWTAYDNLGEVGTGRFLWERDGIVPGITLADYPWRTCYQGDFDICGFRRPQSYFRESIWIENCEPKIFTTHPEHYGEGFSGTGWHWYDVNDTWTFDDKYIGKPVKVEVYTDADEIQFFLNGNNVASAKPVDGIATTDIIYEKGTLTAVSYKNGKEIKSSSLNTVDKPQKIKLVPVKTQFIADNRDLCYFEIFITDKNGNRVPHAENELSCTCSGGDLMCIFSGNPKNEDNYTSNKCHAFEGRSIAVIRAKTPGNITITVEGENLESDSVEVLAK